VTKLLDDEEIIDYVERISHVRILLSQLVNKTVQIMVEKYTGNSLIEFQTLIMIHSLFGELLPSPTA